MSEQAAKATEVLYDLTKDDVDSLFTIVSGLVTVNLFTLLVQLLILGVLLVVVFVIALRRF